MNCLRFESRQGQDIFFSPKESGSEVRPASCSMGTGSLTQGYSCGGVKLLASSAKFMSEWSYASAPPLRPYRGQGKSFPLTFHMFMYTECSLYEAA